MCLRTTGKTLWGEELTVKRCSRDADVCQITLSVELGDIRVGPLLCERTSD